MQPRANPAGQKDSVSSGVAIIIVNWKVRELLRECLDSVRASSGWPWGTYEVIVVDNNSSDGSVEMVRAEFPDVTLVANAENTGFGAANNLALTMTDAKWVVLLNPDTVVKDRALARMVDELQADASLAIVGCKLLNKDGSLQRWTAGAFPTLANVAAHYLFLDKVLPSALRPKPLYLDSDSTEPRNVGWISGACMAIRRQALDGRLFDRRFFMYAEDMELCYRLNTAGWKVRYQPQISIIHYQGASLQQQSSEIMLSSLKCPRHFFEILHGKRAAAVFDKIVVLGFGIRWMMNTAAAGILRNVKFRSKAASSRSYLNLALSVMRNAKENPQKV